MAATAELAERLDVRLHTHLAEDLDEDAYCLERYGCRPVQFFEDVGWLSDRSWVAHCVHPNPSEIERLGQAGVGVAHCPSSNLLLGAGLAPVAELGAAGVPVGLGCDGSSSADSASALARSPHGDAPGPLPVWGGLDGRSPGARDGDARWGGVPRPAGRARGAPSGGSWRPGVLAARWPPLRRRAHRPSRGPPALRARPGLPHHRGRASP